jgi:hypothetical protein
MNFNAQNVVFFENGANIGVNFSVFTTSFKI